MKIYNDMTELIGRTPIVRLKSFEEEGFAKILAKLESANPCGSAKDRVALNIILDAEKCGALRKGATIVEPTSGNTGIGLAAVGATRGYRVILTMPDTMSVGRIKLLRAYGAEIVLTEGKLGMQGAVDKAKEISETIPDSFIAGQFDNPANPDVHYRTTGPEIWDDTDGQVDILVAGVGTGGTLSGVGKYLKEKNPSLAVVAVEPDDSPLLSRGTAGPHKLQGIGANFVPENLDLSLIDEIITVTTEDAFAVGNKLAKKEGLLCGISSGAALWAAAELSKREENKGKNIVVILPDSGERYFSTPMFD